MEYSGKQQQMGLRWKRLRFLNAIVLGGGKQQVSEVGGKRDIAQWQNGWKAIEYCYLLFTRKAVSDSVLVVQSPLFMSFRFK